MDLSNHKCGMCGNTPVQFAVIITANHEAIRLNKPLCGTCAPALGTYLDSIVDRVGVAAETDETLFATAKALEREAEIFVAARAKSGISGLINNLLDSLGVRHG